MNLDSDLVSTLSKSVQSKARDIDVEPDMIEVFGWSKKSKPRLMLASPSKFILVDDEVRELSWSDVAFECSLNTKYNQYEISVSKPEIGFDAGIATKHARALIDLQNQSKGLDSYGAYHQVLHPEESPEIKLQAVKSQARSDIILTTLPTVPGYNITILKGLVFAAGNAAFTLEGTASKAGTAMDKAEEQLRSEAVRLGGNAVIGVAFSMDGAGNAINRSQTITLIGTAVVIQPNSE